MEPKLFDIHCHLNLPDFAADRQAVLERTLDAGCWLINVGADLESSKKAVEIAETKDAGVWATVGFHPTDAADLSEESWNEAKELARNPKVLAIGECGLEYFRDPSAEEKKRQEKVFRDHAELALALNKPLMIHCRPSKGSQDAYSDIVGILNEYKREAGDRLRGDMHFFAGNWETAKGCLDLGFTLSFTGVITFANQYDEIVRNAPSDMIMAETDAPFVAPVPFRGTRSEPLHVAETVKRMAELRGISAEEMARITVQNGRRMFGI